MIALVLSSWIPTTHHCIWNDDNNASVVEVKITSGLATAMLKINIRNRNITDHISIQLTDTENFAYVFGTASISHRGPTLKLYYQFSSRVILNLMAAAMSKLYVAPGRTIIYVNCALLRLSDLEIPILH
jgi:hypothetical protein